MRRCPIAKGLEQVAKAGLGHLGRDLQHLLKHSLLEFGLVDTNRTAAELDAVHHHVVVLPPNLFGILGEKRNVLGNGSRERVMARIPPVLFLVEAQQWKINHPKEIKTPGRNAEFAEDSQNLDGVEPDAAEDFAREQPFAGGEQDQIAFLDPQVPRQGFLLGRREELGDGRFPVAVLDLDECEALGAGTGGDLGHGIDLALGGAGKTFGV